MPRFVQVPLAALALLLFSPILLVALVVSAVSLRAWPFFAQPRVGRHGHHFTIRKIRTLPTTTGAAIDKYALAEVRIPHSCRLLRRFHVDELPQLLNVLDGTMSIVGPRPEMPHLDAEFEPEQRRARHDLLPGMTGLWQVSVGARGLIHETPEYDIVYAERRSWSLDLRIVLRTIAKVLRLAAPITANELEFVRNGGRLPITSRPRTQRVGV